MARVTVRIHNAYEDGHESTHEVLLDPPATLADDVVAEWWEEAVWPETGDGHGIGGLNACYTATVIAADEESLVGREREWA
jgi:hypothetical protein